MSRYTKICLISSLFGCLAFTSTVTAGSLTEIYQLALEHDPQLKVNQARWRAEKAGTGIARAALLPQLNATISYSDTDGERETLIGSDRNAENALSINELESDQLNQVVTLSQILFSLPDYFSVKRARQLKKRSEVFLAESQQDLIQRSVENYFSVLRATAALRLTTAEEQALRRQLGQTQDRFNAGLTAVTDVLEAQATYDAVRASRLSLETNLISTLEALQVLTGRRHDRLWRLAKNFPIRSPEPDNLEVWENYALDNNYALRAALLATTAAQQQYRSIAGEHYPSLRGELTYRKSEDIFSGLSPYNEDETNTAGITLQIPLSSGGRTSARRKQAYQQYLQMLETEEQLRRQTLREVRTLFASLRISVERINARHLAVRSSRNALHSIRDGYETGTRDLSDVVRAEQNLYRVQRELSSARIDFVIDSARFKAVCGALQPQDIDAINRYLTP